MRRLFEIKKTIDPVKCTNIDEGFCMKHGKWCFTREFCEVKVSSGFAKIQTTENEKHTMRKKPYTEEELKKIRSIVKKTPYPDSVTIKKLSERFNRSPQGIKHAIKITRNDLIEKGEIC